MNPWRTILRLPRPVWLVAGAIFVNRVGTMALPFLALYLTRARGFDGSTAGFVLALYGAGAIVASPLAGRLADRYGAARVVAASLLASGVVLLLYPLGVTLAQVGASTFLLALVGEMARPASMALVGAVAEPAQRKPAFALVRLSVNLGMSVGPAVGGFLATRWFPALFLIDGATAILAAGVFAAAFWRRPPARAPGPEDVAPGEGAAPPSRRAHSDAPFLYFLAAVFLAALVNFQLDGALPLDLVRGMGVPLEWFGAMFTVNTAMILVLEVPLNGATAAWPHRRSLALGTLLYGVGLGVLAVVRSRIGLFLSTGIWTAGEMILMPAMSAYVADASPRGRSGEYMGMFSGAFAVGFLVGPWGGVLLLERLGPRPFWVLVLACGVAAAAMMATVREAHRPATADPG